LLRTRTASVRPAEARRQGDAGDLAVADAPQRHLAVDAAPVEPRAVQPEQRLRGGRAPVGPDGDVVAAGVEQHARLERLVGALVGGDAAPVDEDLRARGDRFEA
jgi:hypothetical protein